MKFKITRYFLVLAVAFTGCNKLDIKITPVTNTGTTSTTTTTSNSSTVFVSATATGSYTAAQLQSLANTKGYESYSSFIKYDVDFYKIIYNTSYHNQTIQASGLLAIPKNTGTTPALLSAQHGTIMAQADAPSNFPNSFAGYELFASAGFVTVIPDYIGYGNSSTTTHPYYDTQYSASAVVDMIQAAKYYLGTINSPISNKLFLVGYSEGGYTTLSAQESIESSPNSGLTVTAASEGAGGYDLTSVLSNVASVKTYPDPSFLAYILESYNITYGWTRPLSDFFLEPYATKIPQLINGTNTELQINAGLTTSLGLLFNPTFYNNLSLSNGEMTLKYQLYLNSFNAWHPTSPTRMYHGTADEDVPYQTSQTTYNKFITAGSTSLTLNPIKDGTHETSVQPMMLDAIAWFKSLQ